MTKSYVVSAAGCRRREEPFVVPEGVHVVFYRARPHRPAPAAGRSALDELRVAVRLLPATVAAPGVCVPAAFCWARAGDAASSGVFRRSTGARVMALADTGVQRPVALAHIVAELAQARAGRLTVIHWLVEPSEVAPDPASWQLQFPPRASASDADESRHAALDGPLRGHGPSEEAVPPGWFTVGL